VAARNGQVKATGWWNFKQKVRCFFLPAAKNQKKKKSNMPSPVRGSEECGAVAGSGGDRGGENV